MKTESKKPPLSIKWLSDAYQIVDWELIKYASTSLLATVCDFSTFYFLNDGYHFPTLGSVWTGQIMGSIVTFILLYKWVFRFVEQQALGQLILKFFGGQIASAAANVSVVGLMIWLFQTGAWTSKIATSILLWIVLFLVNKLWVFKSQKSIVTN